jgi:pantetheine-phosphate adenylyltransferase
VSVAVYPGSFDPITVGHLDIIRRAAGVFGEVVVAVLRNPRKAPLFDERDRVETIREAIVEECPDIAAQVEVATFEGLTVDFAQARGARFIVRGLRAVSDFESEMQMAHTNRKMAPAVDTIFFMTALEHAYLSSSLVKEIAMMGGDVSEMVPRAVARRLHSRLGL